MKLHIVFILLISFVFVSCKNESIPDDVDANELDIDTTSVVDLLTDIDTVMYVSETVENDQIKKEIEKKYGKQWDFCDCVRKNDSITKVIDKMGDNDDYDPVFERMEEIDKHCKELLTTPNTTPEERDKHQKRVKKCLKSK